MLSLFGLCTSVKQDKIETDILTDNTNFAEKKRKYNFKCKNRKRKRKYLLTKIKKSPDERHTSTYGSFTDTFQQSQIFLIRKE